MECAEQGGRFWGFELLAGEVHLEKGKGAPSPSLAVLLEQMLLKIPWEGRLGVRRCTPKTTYEVNPTWLLPCPKGHHGPMAVPTSTVPPHVSLGQSRAHTAALQPARLSQATLTMGKRGTNPS